MKKIRRTAAFLLMLLMAAGMALLPMAADAGPAKQNFTYYVMLKALADDDHAQYYVDQRSLAEALQFLRIDGEPFCSVTEVLGAGYWKVALNEEADFTESQMAEALNGIKDEAMESGVVETNRLELDYGALALVEVSSGRRFLVENTGDPELVKSARDKNEGTSVSTSGSQYGAIGQPITMSHSIVGASIPGSDITVVYTLSKGLTKDGGVTVSGISGGGQTYAWMNWGTPTIDQATGAQTYEMTIPFSAISGGSHIQEISQAVVLNKHAKMTAPEEISIYLKNDSRTLTETVKYSIFTYGMEVHTTDGTAESNAVPGASYMLQNEDDQYYKESDDLTAGRFQEQRNVVTADENGVLSFEGLTAGSYKLTQVKTKFLHQRMTEPVTVTISGQGVITSGRTEVQATHHSTGYSNTGQCYYGELQVSNPVSTGSRLSLGQDKDAAAIGDKVTHVYSFALEEYTSGDIQLKSTWSKGLTKDTAGPSVKIDGTELSDDQKTWAVWSNPTTDSLTRKQTYTLTVPQDVIAQYAGKRIMITQTSILNANAKAAAAETCEAWLASGGEEDSKKTFKVYTFGMEIHMISGTGESLGGGRFRLEKRQEDMGSTGLFYHEHADLTAEKFQPGESYLTADTDGILRLEGLKSGFYMLTQMEAAQGYERIEGSRFIVISDVGQVDDPGISGVTVENQRTEDSSFYHSIFTVINEKTAANLKSTGSITLNLQNAPVSMENAGFSLYKVGTWNTDKWQLADSLQSTGVVLENLQQAADWQAAARTLAEQCSSLTGTSGQIGKSGTLTFDKLERGVYLIVQTSGQAGTADPILVEVMRTTDDLEAAHRFVSPKVVSNQDDPDEGSTNKPKPHKKHKNHKDSQPGTVTLPTENTAETSTPSAGNQTSSKKQTEAAQNSELEEKEETVVLDGEEQETVIAEEETEAPEEEVSSQETAGKGLNEEEDHLWMLLIAAAMLALLGLLLLLFWKRREKEESEEE